METIKLSEFDVEYLEKNYPDLQYNKETNIIEGVISFDLQYKFIKEAPIQDKYKIKIDLNNLTNNAIPNIRETGGRIFQIASSKNLNPEDLHLNLKNNEICIIIPPKIKKRYPNGFDLKELLYNIEEHFYWISYYEKYNKPPWKSYGHREVGYVELYIENKELYSEDVKRYFGNLPRSSFRKKIRDYRKKYGI